MQSLDRNFFLRDPVSVAKELLGKILLRELDGQIISGMIVEVEAYLGQDDAAAHSSIGKTKRNASLFEIGGHIYIHSIHSQHCIDVVCGDIDHPVSVLIRALEPIEGIEIMRKLRGKDKITDLTSGPGKLTKALGIDKTLDGLDITQSDSPVKIISDDSFKVDYEVTSSGRIGISKAKELPLRFYLKGNKFVSR